MTKVLCIISRTPYENSHSLELLETAMVGAVFDFQMSLLFRGEGVWGLVKDQNAAALGRRTFSKVLGALPTYDVDRIYVCEDSLQRAGLDVSQFAVNTEIINSAAQAALIGAQDAVMGAQS